MAAKQVSETLIQITKTVVIKINSQVFLEEVMLRKLQLFTIEKLEDQKLHQIQTGPHNKQMQSQKMVQGNRMHTKKNKKTYQVKDKYLNKRTTMSTCLCKKPIQKQFLKSQNKHATLRKCNPFKHQVSNKNLLGLTMILKLVQVKIFKVAALFIQQLKAKTKRSKNQRLWIPK